MPRWESSEAGAAGAGKSVPERQSASKGLEEARKKDRAYFQKNPRAKSYTRPYIEGEYLLLEAHEPRPLLVVVAFVSAGITTKAAVFNRAHVGIAKQDVEAQAALWRNGAPRGIPA